MEIRALTSADLEALEAFYRSLTPATVALFMPFGPDAPREKMVEHLALAEAGEHVSRGLVNDDGEIEGHCYVSNIHAEKPSFGLGLRERMQGQGWGPKLTAAVFEDPRAAHLPLVTLTVVKANERAWRIYERYGFVIDEERRPSWVPEESYYMERRL